MNALDAVGFSPRWQALLADCGFAKAEPGRVLRHDGVAHQVRTATGDRSVALGRGLPPVTVGGLDRHPWGGWGCRARSRLPAAAASGDGDQLLAANVDLVLLVAGLDRPVKAGRIRRGEALALDAGARPLLVLTKADLAHELDTIQARVAVDHAWRRCGVSAWACCG